MDKKLGYVSVSVNVHPTPEQIALSVISSDNISLRIQGDGYTGVYIFINREIASAIVTALKGQFGEGL